MPEIDVILGGSPDANNLAHYILELCLESECVGYEVVGALESVKFQLISEGNDQREKWNGERL